MALNLSLDDDIARFRRLVFFDRTMRGYMHELHDSYRDALQRVAAMRDEARHMRAQTRDLLSDFSQFSGRVHQLRRLQRQVQMEAASRHEDLDDVLYMKGMIRHLVDSNARMRLVPCVVLETGDSTPPDSEDRKDKKDRKGRKEKKEKKEKKKAK